MNNPTNNKNLNDLLKKSGSESLDDFEKEALEGFNSLESSEEALDIKSQVDKRIYAEVFSKKKSGIKVYWYAAAGLFLAIGFSVFLLWDSNNVIEKDNLAMTVAEQKSPEKQSPPPATANLEEPKALHDDSPAEIKNKVNSRNDIAQSALAKKPAAGPGDAFASSSASSVAENAATPQPAEVNKSAETMGAKNDMGNMDDKRAEEKPMSEGKAQKTAALDLDEVSTKNQVKNEPKISDKKKAKEDRARKESQGADNSELKKESAEESENSKDKAGGYVNNNRSQPDNNNVSRQDKKAAEKSPSSPGNLGLPAGSVHNGGSANCYYSGGENALVKELKEKLISKDLNKKFDALLFINDAKKVEKVTITNSYDLKPDDEIHIREILQTLSKFEFQNVPTVNSMREYKLSYRP